MQSEKLTCAKKLQELLKGFWPETSATSIEVHTTKESACSTPRVEAVEFRQGDKFVIIKAEYGLTVLVPPTPKLVKKDRITGTVGGVEVSKVFDQVGEYSASLDFFNGLVNAKREEIEEPEA